MGRRWGCSPGCGGSPSPTPGVSTAQRWWEQRPPPGAAAEGHPCTGWSQRRFSSPRCWDFTFSAPPRLRGIKPSLWLKFSPLASDATCQLYLPPSSRCVPWGVGRGALVQARTAWKCEPSLPPSPSHPIPSHPHLHSLRRLLSAACSIVMSHTSVQETQGPPAAPGSPVDPGRDGQQAAQPR